MFSPCALFVTSKDKNLHGSDPVIFWTMPLKTELKFNTSSLDTRTYVSDFGGRNAIKPMKTGPGKFQQLGECEYIKCIRFLFVFFCMIWLALSCLVTSNSNTSWFSYFNCTMAEKRQTKPDLDIKKCTTSEFGAWNSNVGSASLRFISGISLQFNFIFYLCYVMLEGKLTLKGPLQQYHQLSWNQIHLCHSYILCFNVYKVRKRCESQLQSRTTKICYVCYINYMKIVTVNIMTMSVKQSIHKVRNHQAMPLQYERSAGVHPCLIVVKTNIDLQDAKKPCTWDVVAVQMPQTWKNVPQRLRQFRVHSYLVEGEFRVFFRDGLGEFRVGWRFWLAAPFRSSHQNTYGNVHVLNMRLQLYWHEVS